MMKSPFLKGGRGDFHINEFDDQNLCQTCKEELGMLSLMGFDAQSKKFS